MKKGNTRVLPLPVQRYNKTGRNANRERKIRTKEREWGVCPTVGAKSLPSRLPNTKRHTRGHKKRDPARKSHATGLSAGSRIADLSIGNTSMQRYATGGKGAIPPPPLTYGRWLNQQTYKYLQFINGIPLTQALLSAERSLPPHGGMRTRAGHPPSTHYLSKKT